MNPAKCDEYDYINFLIAAQKVFSASEAGRVGVAAHDAYTRLLQRIETDTQALWEEVKGCVNRKAGVLVIDDSTLDKPYANKMGLVTRHWSGKHSKVVQGINVQTLLWTKESQRLPCDYRIYNKEQDGLSKNDHFQAMTKQAAQRGFEPDLFAFDSWYSSLANLKQVRQLGWDWLTRLKKNRQVSPAAGQRMAISELFISRAGTHVHLKGYGMIKVFRSVDKNGNAEYWATSQLDMLLEACAEYALDAWQIEVFHRDLKQYTGVERARFRLAVAQRNHIGLAIRAFVRLETTRIRTTLSFFEQKQNIIRDALRAYLLKPHITLLPTA